MSMVMIMGMRSRTKLFSYLQNLFNESNDSKTLKINFMNFSQEKSTLKVKVHLSSKCLFNTDVKM